LISRVLASTLVLILLASPAAAPIPVAHAATTFTVTVQVDATDDTPCDGLCYNGVVEGCTLRAALQEAFCAASPPTTILFAPSLAGLTVNVDLGPLNWAASDTTVDGEAYGITIDGSGLAGGQSIFQVSGNNNAIQNLTVRGAPQDGIQVGDFAGVGAGNNNVVGSVILIGNGAAGVYVHGSASSGGQNNHVVGDLIGASDNSATTCAAGEGNGGSGVYIDQSAMSTLVSACIIVCNTGEGVYINGSGGAPISTTISYNDIGNNGTVALPNGGEGVLDLDGIGTLIVGNLLSGNNAAGIWLDGSAYAVARGNYIGLNFDGSTRLPNGHDGVAITDAAYGCTIGGTSGADRNYISGNTACGVRIRDGATLNLLEDNVIGLGTGGAAAPNACGVAVINANSNTIGSDLAGITQVISGNTREGIYVERSDWTYIGSANNIGIGLDGTAARGNGLEGVMLITATNTIVKPARVMYNGGAGIAVVGNTATGNRLSSMEVHGNGGIAFDLGNDGHTANGAHTPPGPNNWINYPVITSTSGSNIGGTTCSSCVVAIYQASGDPITNGGGGTYLDQTTADTSGNWSYVLSGGLTASDVTLTALDPATSDSSEMSPLFVVRVFLPIVVKN
jgi:hypothetical protein